MPTIAAHVWAPSTARVLSLVNDAPGTGSSSIASTVNSLATSSSSGSTSTTTSSIVALAWPAKDPTDVLDYILDVGDMLSGDPGDGIGTLDVSIEPAAPGDLTLNLATATGTRAVLWLSGGQIGTTYTVTLTIGTNGGRVLNRSVQLAVISLTDISTGSDNALLTELGTQITDETGDSLTLGS